MRVLIQEIAQEKKVEGSISADRDYGQAVTPILYSLLQLEDTSVGLIASWFGYMYILDSSAIFS